VWFMKLRKGLKTEDLFPSFFDGLLASVSDYEFEPGETVPVCLLQKEIEKKYMPDVDEIVKRQYASVKRYCDEYFGKLVQKPTDKLKAAIDELLLRLKKLVGWDTNAYHIETKIFEDKLTFTEGTTAQWFPVYKSIADGLTKGIFEEDKEFIERLWKCVMKKII